ncbi:hypothetical protein V8J82_23205 [Gymnodinialimonas sp. 2305UL16-5]|uniref:hypothetical protein n=1 Tax=Gymnodinialimonas mytili TaxID=3126503 RepID=UPI0030A3758A
MARPDEQQQGGDRDRESLGEFVDRFGQLKDRMEKEVHPELDRQEMPTAEHPASIAAREAAEAAAQEKPEHEVWPGEEAKPDFDRAASNENTTQDRQGVNSRQVAEDAPEHNLPPPKEGEQADRSAHAQRMAQDDRQSRRPMTDKYYDRLAERMREAQADREASGQDQRRDQGRDFEHSR